MNRVHAMCCALAVSACDAAPEVDPEPPVLDTAEVIIGACNLPDPHASSLRPVATGDVPRPDTPLNFSNSTPRQGLYDYAPAVMRDDNGVYKMWWCGQSLTGQQGGPWDPAFGDHIMYAESASLDGPWSYPRSVLEGTDDLVNTHDALSTCDPSVIKINGLYWMYYGSTSFEPYGCANPDGSTQSGTTRIGVAYSADGQNWTRVTGSGVKRSLFHAHVEPEVDGVAAFCALPPARRYGIGQPSVAYANGWFYMIVTETTAPASNPSHGAGKYVMRSTDPSFRTSLQELTGPGVFTPRPNGTGEFLGTYSVWEGFQVDWQYVPQLNAFAVAEEQGGDAVGYDPKRTQIQLRGAALDAPGDAGLVLPRETIQVEGNWHDGAGLVSSPLGQVVSGACDRIPFDVVRATGGENMLTWDLAHSGVDLVADSPIDPEWGTGRYVADDTGVPGQADFVLIQNPHDIALYVLVTFVRSNGSSKQRWILMQPNSRETVPVHGEPDVGGRGDVSVAVQSSSAAHPVFVEHATYTGGGISGRASEGTVPARQWYFAEGNSDPAWGERISVFNPGRGRALLTFEYLTPAGREIRTEYVPTGPGRITINTSQHLGRSTDHGLYIHSDRDIVVERVMEWGGGTESHASPGVSREQTAWYFAEGAKANGWATFMMIANSSAQPNLVRVRYLHQNGAFYDHDLWVPAGGRATLSADATPAVPAGSFGYHVFSLSGLPMVAERSMYFGPGWSIGTSGVGTPAPATTWYFAEGSTGYYDTFILLANTSATAASVRLRFQLTGGGFVERDAVVPASGRRTFYVNSEGGLAAGSAFSTRVTSLNGVPVVAERAMYWQGGNWFGAHVTLGSR